MQLAASLISVWLHHAESSVEVAVQAAEALRQELRELAADEDTKVGFFQPFSISLRAYATEAFALTLHLVSNAPVQSRSLPTAGPCAPSCLLLRR